MELQNLMLAITLAKANIVSPNILDHADLKSVWFEEPTDTPIADLMSISSVKVLQSANMLYFIISFPKIEHTCKKITVYPVAHKNHMLRIENNIIAECQDQIYALENCTATPKTTFCQRSTASSCAKDLHTGGVAHCELQPSINDAAAEVCIDNGTVSWVHGTQLIIFNKWVTVNGTKYINRNSVQNRFPGIAASPLLNVTGHQDVLSLPYLHRLNERNLETIQEVRDEVGSINSIKLLLLLGITCGIIFGIGLTYRQIMRKRATALRVNEVIAEIGSAEGGLNLRGE